LELLRANALQKQIMLENSIEDDIHVNADPLILRSILQNLVTNAIKFTPYGGNAIRVTAQSANDEFVEVCVRDSGIGMSKKTKNMLLRESEKTSVPGTDKEMGTGLGLLLVKDFVQLHGGTIEVESELGKGTCFRFTMPKT
jgi:signal transduction histidine kinase